MAVSRQAPRCEFCDEVITEAKYKDQSHLPINMQIIGDTFEGWEYLDHSCRGKEEFQKQVKEVWRRK